MNDGKTLNDLIKKDSLWKFGLQTKSSGVIASDPPIAYACSM